MASSIHIYMFTEYSWGLHCCYSARRIFCCYLEPLEDIRLLGDFVSVGMCEM